MYFILAWRNLWKNRKRTLITISSVTFAVFFAIMMRSIQQGTFTKIINDVLKFYTGHLQIQKTGYWENKTLDYVMEIPDSVYQKINAQKRVKLAVKRLETFALASEKDKTRGVMLIGTDPVAENNLTMLADRVIQGTYLTAEDSCVLVASGLAEYLGISVGDSLVLLTQGFQGVSAAAKYPVKGIVKFASPELNRQSIYLPLKLCQNYLSASEKLTSLAILADNNQNIANLCAQIQNNIGKDYAVISWETMLEEILQLMVMKNSSGLIMQGILYLVISFGVFGTVLMMVMERRKEFAMMIALGTRKSRLVVIVFIETVLICFIGAISGMIAALPVIYYFILNPLRYTGEAAKAMNQFGFEPLLVIALDWRIFLYQAILVLILSVAAMIYPVLSIFRLNVIKTIRA